MANHNPLSTRERWTEMSANTGALTLILHRTQRVADEAINRALDCSLTSHRGAPWSTPHVTCVTRHAQNARPTSRCRTVAPWSTTMRRAFHPETNGVKAGPHRLKWMLSRGALAAPSDPWNSHAAPVSPRQNCWRAASRQDRANQDNPDRGKFPAGR